VNVKRVVNFSDLPRLHQCVIEQQYKVQTRFD